MTDCDLCKHFRAEPNAADSGGTWYCDFPGMTNEEFGTHLGEDEDCPHWYPGEQQTKYHKENDQWVHRCDGPLLKVDIFWVDVIEEWRASTGMRGYFAITFCPFCGLELAPMPEVEE